jgi:hypothetical protein
MTASLQALDTAVWSLANASSDSRLILICRALECLVTPYRTCLTRQ